MTINALNALSREACLEALEKCCGAHRWVEAMEQSRPFADMDDLLQKADEYWAQMNREDALEAFSHHPQIGDINSLREKFASTRDWAGNEQSGVNEADEQVLKELSEGNQAYLDKYGYIFIVCATGKTAEEMRDLLFSRLNNEPEEELQIAMGEQHKITRIRLNKLLS